jgi:hypothetical protein
MHVHIAYQSNLMSMVHLLMCALASPLMCTNSFYKCRRVDLNVCILTGYGSPAEMHDEARGFVGTF